MKILDKYVAKSFLIGYAISFCVLIGLRIIIDLFVNLDEFTEHADLGSLAVVRNILTFYGLNMMLYFRDFAGMITVVAAAFSLGKMVRNNELAAIMASGVSLKRLISPIVVLALVLTGLLVIDQEVLIPPFGDKLVRDRDDVPGREAYAVRFITDGAGSLISTSRFDAAKAVLYKPTIITRRRIPRGDSAIWQVTGRIDADRAIYNKQSKGWDLVNGRFTEKDSAKMGHHVGYPTVVGRPIAFYASDITPKEIPVRLKSEDKTLLSFRQLTELAAGGAAKDQAQLFSQKHFRVTEPIINLAMLMVCLPILVCRDPKSMKTAIMFSFEITGACMITSFVCKLMATEVVLGAIRPEFWAWVPVLIFVPVAFIELDSMKT
jgi:lipopolysaccharide export system permease protein